MTSYSDKMKDPRWQKRRLKILERDQWTCQECDDTKTTLHVHHLWYETGEPWDSPDEALQTVSADCHESESILRGDSEQNLLRQLRRSGFTVYDIWMLGGVVCPFRPSNRFDRAFFIRAIGSFARTDHSRRTVIEVSEAYRLAHPHDGN